MPPFMLSYWRQFNTKSYSLIQLGITIFIYSPENHAYALHPFNFHVFNSQSSRNFCAEPRTLQFLTDHGIDFNFLFQNGISYMTQEREATHRKRLESELSRKQAQLKKLFQNESIDKEQPREQLNNRELTMDDNIFQQTVRQALEKLVKSDDAKELTFNESNNWRRRLIYDTVNYTFKGKLYPCKVGDLLTIRKIKLDDQDGYSYDEMVQFEKEKIENSLAHELGVTQVIRLLIEYKHIPIIGHNTSMDWIYIIRQFIQPLENTSFQDFIEIFKHSFPKHIDVKIVATIERYKITLTWNKIQEFFHVFDFIY